MSISSSMSIPRTLAKSLTTGSGTTPAISWISDGRIGVGGFVEEDNRDADCRYVMARRRSPEDVVMRASMTFELISIFSVEAMYDNLRDADSESSGVKRNFEHRDARGSIILYCF